MSDTNSTVPEEKTPSVSLIHVSSNERPDYRNTHEPRSRSLLVSALSTSLGHYNSQCSHNSQMSNDVLTPIHSTGSSAPTETGTTIYYTAKTSLQNPQLESRDASAMLYPMGVIYDDNNEDNNDEDINVDDDEPIVFDELTHRPPFVPNHQTFSNFGKPNLRQTIISRQSTRLLPPGDRLIERMEEQMVRWGAPQSSFRVDDILNGKHAFQKSEVPLLDIVRDSQIVAGSERESANSDGVTTDSMTDSIARSPYVNLQPPEQVPVRPRHNFSEQNDLTTNQESSVDLQTSSVYSLQDSAVFNTRAGDYDKQRAQPMLTSASISSSMFARINGDHSPTVQEGLPNSGVTGVDILTAEAFPLTPTDINELVKNQPRLQQEMLLNPIPVNNQLSEDYDEPGCWELFTEGLNDMWLDIVDCFTCNWSLQDTQIYAY